MSGEGAGIYDTLLIRPELLSKCRGPGNDVFVFFKKYLFIYLFVYLFWLHRVLVAACMWDLVPRPGIEPRPPALGAQSLTHWTTIVAFRLTALSLKVSKHLASVSKTATICILGTLRLLLFLHKNYWVVLTVFILCLYHLPSR